MGEEESELWRAVRADGQKKRWSNRDTSMQNLRARGYHFKTLSAGEAHFRVRNPDTGKESDFWPTTGKYYDYKTKKTGRGVFNLMKYLGPIKHTDNL